MDKAEKRKVFEIATSNFETDNIKEYFLDMCEEIPDYIFVIPASTTMKYHNKTQCQKFGQLYHEFMFASIMEHRLRLKGNKEKFSTPEIRDCMRCVPFFHDAIKCGLNGSQYTVQDHPMLAAEWVRQTKVEHDVSAEYKEMIACMCESHSGEWNKSRAGKEIMPEPRNDMEFFVHECDILSSRSDIDMIIPNELKTALGDANISDESLPKPDINTYKFPFGKHKGLLIKEIAEKHKDYLEWVNNNVTMQEPLNTFVKELLK